MGSRRRRRRRRRRRMVGPFWHHIKTYPSRRFQRLRTGMEVLSGATTHGASITLSLWIAKRDSFETFDMLCPRGSFTKKRRSLPAIVGAVSTIDGIGTWNPHCGVQNQKKKKNRQEFELI
jgi:hypothetical protein